MGSVLGSSQKGQLPTVVQQANGGQRLAFAQAGDKSAMGDVMDLPIVAEAFDLVGILSAVDETAYNWDLTSDSIAWEANVNEVLGVSNPEHLKTGRGYQSLISPEHLSRRHDAIVDQDSGDAASGAPFRVQYQFIPGGKRSTETIWIEDHGRCWFDDDGKPIRARGVIRVINDRYWEEQRLLHYNDHDELTGQLNRVRLNDALGAFIQRTTRTQQSCALLIASVNNLAVFNSNFGFDVGDEVIASVARMIKSKLRGGDTVGRYSSNKFGIILSDCGPGAMRIASERFISAVRSETIETSACQLSATISIGGVVLPAQADTPNEALSCALQALDQAKQRRIDCFMPFEPSPTRETTRQRNIAIADEVVSALEENRMHLVLQPIVSTQSGKADLYECLMRMEKPDGTVVSAGEFIEVAEQLGLSRMVDRRTLELSIDLLRKHSTLKLAVNVSALTTSDQDWLVALHKLTGGKHELTSRLTIEITETVAIHDLDQTVAFVDTVKELGCRVAIDDFGAGYTSFKNLKILNVDMVKIDGTFVKNLVEETSDQVFIRTMVDIAREFNMETVAEWVGDQATVDFLKDAGITYLQGFHFGMPFMTSDLAKHLDK